MTAAAPTARREPRRSLSERLDAVLDDGTGSPRPELAGVKSLLLAVPNRDPVRHWLLNGIYASSYLNGLARGDIPLTHDAIDELSNQRAAAYLRDVLVQAGALPPLDRQLALYRAWAREQLAAVADPEHARLLRQFHTWSLLPYLNARARRGPLTDSSRHHAAEAITDARRLLTWISDQDLQAKVLSQSVLDAWIVTHPRLPGRRFLRWAITSGHIPPLRLPHRHDGIPKAISTDELHAWTHRVLTDDTLDLRARVAAGLVLVTAQPMARIVTLTLDDIITTETTADDLATGHVTGLVTLRLGTPPLPLPAPLGVLVTALADRARTSQAAGAVVGAAAPERWLFPGKRHGQHLTPGTLRHQLQALGLPTRPARLASLRNIALQAPAPVIAAALGYDHATAEAARHHAGTAWSRYAPLPR